MSKKNFKDFIKFKGNTAIQKLDPSWEGYPNGIRYMDLDFADRFGETDNVLIIKEENGTFSVAIAEGMDFNCEPDLVGIAFRSGNSYKGFQTYIEAVSFAYDEYAKLVA